MEYLPLQRRDFLKLASAAAVVPIGLNRAAAVSPAYEAAHPRLLPGCCAYSYRKYLEKGPMTMEQFIVKAVELGILGVEVTTYYLKRPLFPGTRNSMAE